MFVSGIICAANDYYIDFKLSTRSDRYICICSISCVVHVLEFVSIYITLIRWVHSIRFKESPQFDIKYILFEATKKMKYANRYPATCWLLLLLGVTHIFAFSSMYHGKDVSETLDGKQLPAEGSQKDGPCKCSEYIVEWFGVHFKRFLIDSNEFSLPQRAARRMMQHALLGTLLWFYVTTQTVPHASEINADNYEMH